MSKATETVYATLRRRIMSGTYGPGQQMKEAHLAEALAVSRTPIRAALQRLVGDGLLISHPRRGVFVPELSNDDIFEVFNLRLLLEGYAASLAAVRAKPEHIEVLEQETERMARLLRERPDTYLAGLQDANHRFHKTLLAAAGAPRLQRMAKDLMEVPILIGGFYVYAEPDIERSIQHHRDLITAIRAGDPKFARDVIRVHLRSSYDTIMRGREEWARASTIWSD